MTPPAAAPARIGRALRRAAVRGALTVLQVAGLLVMGSAGAHAEPTEDPNDPYPDLQFFTETSADPYRLPGQGVWFVTPQGLNCGIWYRGSFGCAGAIPGAPPDVHQIGWIAGDTRVHYDWTLGVRFPGAHGMLPIPPLNYIESEGTTCAATVDGGTYCVRGPWRLFITPTHTWLNGVSHA